MLYNALNARVITHQIDKKGYHKMDQGGDDKVMELDLFFRPGHYDFCYSKL